MSAWLLAVLAAAGGLAVGYLLARRNRGAEPTAELAQARAEVSRRLADIFALQELSFVLSQSLQPKRIAEQMIGYLKRFTDVGGALVVLTTETGGTATFDAADEDPEQRWLREVYRPGDLHVAGPSRRAGPAPPSGRASSRRRPARPLR